MANIKFYPPLRKKDYCSVVSAATETLLAAAIQTEMNNIFSAPDIFELADKVIIQKADGNWTCFIFYYESFQFTPDLP